MFGFGKQETPTDMIEEAINTMNRAIGRLLLAADLAAAERVKIADKIGELTKKQDGLVRDQMKAEKLAKKFADFISVD